MTWVKVLDGKAINVGTTQHHEGAVVEVDDREARKWIDRQLVVETDPPKPARKSGRSAVSPSQTPTPRKRSR